MNTNILAGPLTIDASYYLLQHDTEFAVVTGCDLELYPMYMERSLDLDDETTFEISHKVGVSDIIIRGRWREVMAQIALTLDMTLGLLFNKKILEIIEKQEEEFDYLPEHYLEIKSI